MEMLCDYDVWYLPCTNCGYDTGKSTIPKKGNKTCWKCGHFVKRDFTDRALKLIPEKVMTKFEYGSMSSLFSCEAENKLTAYAVSCLHYQNNAFAIVFYKPEYCKEDRWASFDGKISARLDEIFGGPDSFDKYLEGHVDEIQECFKSIKRLS